MKKKKPQQRHIAHHEAGHAVVAVRFGIQCNGCNILPTHDRAGISNFEGTWSDSFEAWCHACVRFAGYCAGVESGQGMDEARQVSHNDFQNAVETGVDEREGIAVTFELVRRPEYWKAITAIAEELLIHYKLDGTEVVTLVEISDGESTVQDLERYRYMRDYRTEGPTSCD